MKKRTQYFIIILMATVLFSCSTGQNAFKKGNYYNATLQAVSKLRSNPESKKSLEVIQKSYPMALDYYQQKINELTRSNKEDKFYNIALHYEKLNQLADEISRCPAALELLRPVTYFHDQKTKAEELAITEQYNLALELLDTEDYRDARMAIPKLEYIQETKPSYPGISDKIELAIYLSIFKTVVENHPPLHSNYEVNTSPFYFRLFDHLSQFKKNKSLDFYKPQDAEKMELTPNEVLSIQFLDFSISQLNTHEKEESFESDTIAVGTYSDANGNNFEAFGTVKADVVIYDQELLAKGILELTISDFQTGEKIISYKIPEEFLWKKQWATYNGDKRALPVSVLKLTKQKQTSVPSPQEMFLLLSEPIYNQAVAKLNSYYRKK